MRSPTRKDEKPVNFVDTACLIRRICSEIEVSRRSVRLAITATEREMGPIGNYQVALCLGGCMCTSDPEAQKGQKGEDCLSISLAKNWSL